MDKILIGNIYSVDSWWERAFGDSSPYARRCANCQYYNLALAICLAEEGPRLEEIKPMGSCEHFARKESAPPCYNNECGGVCEPGKCYFLPEK